MSNKSNGNINLNNFNSNLDDKVNNHLNDKFNANLNNRFNDILNNKFNNDWNNRFKDKIGENAICFKCGKRKQFHINGKCFKDFINHID